MDRAYKSLTIPLKGIAGYDFMGVEGEKSLPHRLPFPISVRLGTLHKNNKKQKLAFLKGALSDFLFR